MVAQTITNRIGFLLEQAAVFICVAVCLLLPLFRGGGLIYVWLYMLSAALLATALLLAARAARASSASVPGILVLIACCMAAQSCWILFWSGFSSPHDVNVLPESLAPEGALIQGLQFMLYLAMFVAVSMYVNTISRLVVIAGVLFIGVLVQAITGVLSLWAGLHLVPLEYLDGHFSIARGTFINRNHFAAYVGIGISLVAGVLIARQLNTKSLYPEASENTYPADPNRISRGSARLGLTAAICILICFFAILLSESRGGLVAPLLGISILAAIVLPAGKKWIVPACVLLALLLFGLGSTVSENVERSFVRLASLLENDSRLFIWSEILPIIKQHWLTGLGPGSFYHAFEIYRSPDFMQGMVSTAHSEYLQLLVELGVIGLLLWLIPVGLYFRHMFRFLMSAPSTVATHIACASTLVVFTLTIHAIFETHLQQPAVSVHFYVFMALGIVSTGIAAPGGHKNDR